MAPRTLGVRLQRLAAVVLGGLLLFVLGGCGGSSSTSSTDALTAEAVTTTATDLTGANGDGLTASGTGPTITTQPSPVTARIGASASFTVVASGTNLKYQWYKSGALITGATSDKHTIGSVATTDLGAYRVLVSNGTGRTLSNSVKLRVVTALGVWGLYEQSGGTTALTAPTLTATAANQSAVWVTDGGVLTITDPLFTTSGNTSSQENSSFYGLNAGVLASAGTISVTGGKIRTRGSGANGAFAVGSGSTVTLSGVTINATADGGHGVMATQGGKVNLTNVIINTAGKNSAALATDRGGGTITATGGKFVTSGADSPGLYSTGALNVTGAQVVAKGAEAAVIEGSNAISLQSSTVSGALKRGVMIYQSMSGDASGADGVFTMTGGKLSAAVGPLFYVTNSTGTISLQGVTLKATSGTLLQAAAGNWGTSGSNGGIAILTATGQTLTGNLVSDSLSTITATLRSSSTLTGTINKAALSLDATSQWYVAGNSVLTTLSDVSGISGTTITNIYGNGYTVTYNSSLAGNSALGGKTYTLAGGGTLRPQ